jgi:hypothetical protein
MPAGLKLFAVLCCASIWINALVTGLQRAPSGPVTRERVAAERAAARAADSAAKTRAPVLLAIGEIGALLLLIDACRREYEAPRGWPIAIAALGLLSFGTSSIVYYAIWGWRPTRRETPFMEDFCAACKSDSTDRSLSGLFMWNGMLGTRFLGRARHCETCGSSVRTVWFFVVVPLLPLGTYRVLPVGQAMAHKSSFLSRKTQWNSVQLATVYCVLAVIVAVVFWLNMGTRN